MSAAAKNTVPPLATGDRVRLTVTWGIRRGTIVNTDYRFTTRGAAALAEKMYRVRWDNGEVSRWMAAHELEKVT